MTQRDAMTVMATPYQKWFYSRSSPGETWLVFGEWTSTKLLAMNRVRNQLRLSGPVPAGAVEFEDWPVRIRLDSSGRVDRVERGSEVEQQRQ